MTKKEEFFNSIVPYIIPDLEFFKKVYGFSMYDKDFIQAVSSKLIEIGRTDIIRLYNDWLQDWQRKDREAMKAAAKWLISDIDRQFVTMVKKPIETHENRKADKAVINEWDQRQLLLKKKELLLKKKSMLLN